LILQSKDQINANPGVNLCLNTGKPGQL